ncbi:integrase catalytic domain-containing protein [Trichonephila clavipes]|nr:integrase catalytic domain-containing protein [Trichonephila clavipes]
MASLTRLKRLTVLHFTYVALIQVEKSLLGSCAPNQSIVLAWIKKPLAQLKTFVGNRVSIIQELTESDFWKHVNSEINPADILSKYKELEPYDITAVEGDDLFLQELKETLDFPLCALLKNFEPLDIFSNCSSFTKLQRVIAWCKRFIENVRHPMCRTMGPLKNDSGLLRVGGRLRNSPIPRNKKHPMIIPTKHNFTYIIINHVHILYFHTGAEATLANIRNSFWIPSARNVVRKILRTCITCRKVSAKGSQQLMADLPAARVTACRVFSQVGIDYCGPFQLKTFSGKCRQIRKVYDCVFICFTVKAIHLEIVSDLTTKAFLAAIKRFVARRGRPIEIHSDNGRNFVGANNELRKILKALFKVQIEAVLNSRPICPLSNDPNDVETLTPAHFLVGSFVAVPDPDYTEIPMNRLSRWQLVQRMNQHFWRKWSSEYLNRLQQRPKWCKGNVGFKEGDLVLVKPSENSDS